MTPDTLLKSLYHVGTLLLVSFLPFLFNPCTFPTFHLLIVILQLTFIPLLFSVYLHHSRYSSTCFLFSQCHPQTRRASESLMLSHFHLTPICYSCYTCHWCYVALVHFLYQKSVIKRLKEFKEISVYGWRDWNSIIEWLGFSRCHQLKTDAIMRWMSV